MITFEHNIKLSQTMKFEKLFSPKLSATYEEKRAFKMMGGQFIYLLNDGKPIAETYYIPLREDLRDFMEGDEDQIDTGLLAWYSKKNTFYVYSTAVLPEFQSRGIGGLLKAYFYGYMTQFATHESPVTIVGHAREGTSIKLNLSMGAESRVVFPNWFGTGDRYTLYEKIIYPV